MNIGDKVRLLHSKEEGIITKISGNNIIEIEIEEGFTIPIKKSEVVLISAQEEKMFVKPSSSSTKETARVEKVFAQKGIFLAFYYINDQKLSFNFINNTDWDIPFLIGEEKDGNFRGNTAGILISKTFVKIQEITLAEFDKLPVYIFQLLFFRQGYTTLKETFTKKIRLRGVSIFKQNKQNIPIIDKEGYLLQIDKDEKIEKITNIEELIPQHVVAQMFEPKQDQTALKIAPPSREIDLHIEKLTNEHSFMSNSEILQLQINVFEQNLENAIAAGMYEIIFIHGVGNGVLRSEIQKRISKHPEIDYYQDAQKEKFGYGATLIKFK